MGLRDSVACGLQHGRCSVGFALGAVSQIHTNNSLAALFMSNVDAITMGGAGLWPLGKP